MRTSRIASPLGRLLPFVVFAAPALAGACSGTSGNKVMPEATPPALEEAGTPDAARDSSSPPIVDPPKSDAGTPDAPAGECSSSATQTSCITCCSTKHEDGATTYIVAAIECMCLPANCAKECASTLCEPTNPKEADAPCQACMKAKNSACTAAIKASCTADPACVAFDTCVGDSECPYKPN